jgi:iron complex transport system ATP-binding protein
MSSAVQIRHLVFAYGDRLVLDRLSLSIDKGEMVAVLGPNGSGKTTLLKIISAILSGEGEVQLRERDIRSYERKQLSRILAVVPQETQIDFPFTVAEMVLMGRANRHHPLALEDKRDLESARKSMELTETASLADRYLHELSTGEKQRVIIARALAQEPEVLLLDEPSAFLDLKHQISVLQLVRKLNQEQGLTIIAALHDLNLAALFFPRLVMLHRGMVFCDGTPKDVLTEGTIEQVYGIRVKITEDKSGERYQITLPSAR